MLRHKEVHEKLVEAVNSAVVIDAHTHIQDDLLDFDEKLAADSSLSGTQAPFNRWFQSNIDEGLRRKRLVRRTMMDATHTLFYSWFAEIAEGANAQLDHAIKLIGNNNEEQRREAGKFVLKELRDSRYSEYAEWLRIMFRLYDGVTEEVDPLDPVHFDMVYDAVKRQRHDPKFAMGVLDKNNIAAYVTSIENRDKIPIQRPVHPDQVDLGYATHERAWTMFDFNWLVWPERATDFGLFTQGYKFQAEKYLLYMEEILQCTITSVKDLQEAVRGFFFKILKSPKSNPHSRCLYVNGLQHENFRFSTPYSEATVNYAIRHHKDQLNGENKKQVIACVADAMLQTMNDIGKEYKEQGERFGCCLQLCGGVTYFMDWAREIQSFPVAIGRLAQDEYPVWTQYPHVHFEYICAHETMYNDMANAAKQVGNISVGPWWHYFRRHKIARMLYDQLSMGPISSIACGFTDARFVEMLVAKYRSMRLGVADTLSLLVEDRYSSLYMDMDAAKEIIRELLFTNPAAIHHIPVNNDV